VNMDRRRFLRDSSLLISTCTLGSGLVACGNESQSQHQLSETQARDTKAKVELLGSYWTIAGATEPRRGQEYSPFDFRDRVEALSRAGFTGMGIWHADLAHILERRSLNEMRQILDDNGIKHLELEFLTDWFLDGERKQQSDLQRAKLLEAAEALSARHVKVGDFFQEQVSMPKLIESFAGLCADAANVGTRVAFELMPFAMIDTLEGTLEMLKGADADNGGVILDTWHIVKLGITNEQLAQIPKRFLIGVELNDGYLQTPEGMTLEDETIDHRKLCGEGEFDLAGFLAAVQATGFDGPYGVEVISKELRAMPLDLLVNRVYETTMTQFQG
jgi:sugar phosphate isomerase/epimerase